MMGDVMRGLVDQPEIQRSDGTVRVPRGQREVEILGRDELHLVRPRFRAVVEEAWARGENVPRSVVYLSDRELTAEEIEVGRALAKESA